MKNKESAVVKWLKESEYSNVKRPLDTYRHTVMESIPLSFFQEPPDGWIYYESRGFDIEDTGQKYTIPPRLSRHTYKLTPNNTTPKDK